ncbi:MAG: lysine--tRNA ligase [Candidatus Saccharimonadales bacterium]
MTQLTDSNYWIDVEVERIDHAIPDGEIIISSGISPSASYHIGHYPEVLMAEALAWGLRQLGREVRHIHVVDNMDPLRKRYDFLPEEYEQYVGWPICLVPNPYGTGSYADHFFTEFQQYFAAMGIVPTEVVKSYEDLYQTGRMSGQIELVLERLDVVKQIFAEFGREVAGEWTPVQVKGADNTFINARPETWDRKAQTIEGISYVDGGAKLNWRLDWPARWSVLGVQVEPFNNHEHGAAGGSYDTGRAFSERIFNYPAPIPGARYGNVHLGDDTTKMSSSKGNLITPESVLRIIPPSLLRYFIVRSRPPKNLRFYTDKRLINLIDEYKQVAAALSRGEEHEFAEAYRFADLGDSLTVVPFAHLVSVYQAAQGELDRVMAILQRSGYEVDESVLAGELIYVQNWLDSYAPAEVKFALKQDMPVLDLDESQRKFLAALADSLAPVQEPIEAEWMHNTIYELKDAQGLTPAEAFSTIYQIILGQDFGPKAGWFLTTLDKDWLIKRLKLEA